MVEPRACIDEAHGPAADGAFVSGIDDQGAAGCMLQPASLSVFKWTFSPEKERKTESVGLFV